MQPPKAAAKKGTSDRFARRKRARMAARARTSKCRAGRRRGGNAARKHRAEVCKPHRAGQTSAHAPSLSWVAQLGRRASSTAQQSAYSVTGRVSAAPRPDGVCANHGNARCASMSGKGGGATIAKLPSLWSHSTACALCGITSFAEEPGLASCKRCPLNSRYAKKLITVRGFRSSSSEDVVFPPVAVESSSVESPVISSSIGDSSSMVASPSCSFTMGHKGVLCQLSGFS